MRAHETPAQARAGILATLEKHLAALLASPIPDAAAFMVALDAEASMVLVDAGAGTLLLGGYPAGGWGQAFAPTVRRHAEDRCVVLQREMMARGQKDRPEVMAAQTARLRAIASVERNIATIRSLADRAA